MIHENDRNSRKNLDVSGPSARLVLVMLMANSKIEYLYRDASNYKAYPEEDVIVDGRLEWSDFEPVLHMGEMFIPSDVGLPELQSQLENYPNEDDHIWHQLLDLEETNDQSTVEITANEIRRRLDRIEETGWEEDETIEDLEWLKNGEI